MSKIKIISLILILIHVSLIAQDEIRKQQLLIGAFASPDLSFRLLSNNSGTSGSISDNRDSYEIPKLAYTAGVEALYQLKPKLSVSFGIQYSIKGEKTKDLDLIYGDQLDPRRGFVYQWSQEQPTKTNFKYNSSYIDIPIRIDFYFSKRKFAPFVTTGLSGNLFLREKIITTATYIDNHTEKTSSINNNGYYRFNPQFQLGAGLDIGMKKSRLRIFPIYRLSLSRVNKGSVNGYFYSIGLGLNYFLGFNFQKKDS